MATSSTVLSSSAPSLYSNQGIICFKIPVILNKEFQEQSHKFTIHNLGSFNPSDIEISFSGNFFFVSVKKWYFEKKFLIPEDAVIEKMSAYVINGDLVVEFPYRIVEPYNEKCHEQEEEYWN